MNKQVIADFAWGVGIVVLALGATSARNLGYIDADTVIRLVLGATGLMVAWFGNRMPKTIAPSAHARQAQRVGGWSMAISGLVYAGLWAFAPFDVALIGGCAAVIGGIAVTVFYCLSLRGREKAA
jgi:uncharacterized membrane protein